LPEECDGNAPPTWQLTAAVDAMSTTILFGSTRVALRETAATATLGHFRSSRFGWSVTAGGIVAGSIEGRDVSGGATVAGVASWLPVYETARRPFFALTASLGTALIRGTADDGSTRLWSAWDVRGGASVGKTLWGHVVPYAAARVFGGPVFWHLAGSRETGTDRYHVTAGAGLTARLPARLDATVEVMPLGEQSVSGAITWHF
jgi:hypothetical protein